MRAVIFLALSLVPALVATPVSAQSPTVQVGSVIRGTIDGRRTEGPLLSAPVIGEPFRIKSNGREVLLRWDDPTLQLRTRGGHRLLGAAIGMGAAAGVGALLGSASGSPDCTDTDFFGCIARSSVSITPLMGAVVMAPIGAIIGTWAGGGARWTPLGRPTSPPRVGAILSPNRVGVRLWF